MCQTILAFVAMVLAGAFFNRPLLTDAAVGQLALELLKTSDAAEAIEQAAFIVRSPTGALSLLRWPGAGFYGAKWTGAVPDNVLAVIHTHPRARPVPSAQDRAEATRLGLPFYVVSRAALCVADPGNVVSCATRIPWLLRGGEVALNWAVRATGAS